MDYQVKTGDLPGHRTAALVVGIFAGKKKTAQFETLDKAGGGALSRLLRRGDIEGKSGQTVTLYDLPGITAERLMLIGLGEAKSFDRPALGKALMPALRQLIDSGARNATLALPFDEAKDPVYDLGRDIALTAGTAAYRFDRLKTDAESPSRPLKRICLWAADAKASRVLRKGLDHGKAMTSGMDLARDLANLPGNLCTPADLADSARSLGRRSPKLKVKVIEQKEMEKLGMGALLSVARGSRQPPKLIVMEYRGGKPSQKPVALVGKGLTFDAGGISLKPAAEMDEMKYDMCGGASVLGARAACVELDLPINVVGLVPASENLPDGNANKPGDIVTSMSGQTIEILNTDAEGRLILCDALTYAERFHNPAVVVDIATLTGACIIALGSHASGLLGNDDKLADALLDAGTRTGDRAWRLPLWDDYQSQLDSNFADMANIGGRAAGTITAACFLSRYTKKLKWAHLDIAGTAWKSGKEKGATGRPVPLLTQFLIDRAGRAG